MEIEKNVQEKINAWLTGPYDERTKEEIRDMQQHDLKELNESFYKNLEFGTGGLRGIMGAGTNRMNKYTVGMATQGLANYLKKEFPGQTIKVAVAHDCRNNSSFFARITAEIFAANGFVVYLFDALRPTPELSFTIRHLGCQSGVVITASHNPKKYNGYKAYWSDGAQVIAPHDTNIIAEVNKIRSIDDVIWSGHEENIKIIGKEVDEAYLKQIAQLTLSPDSIARNADIRIVYTPIHGTGIMLVPEALKRAGFKNVFTVKEQCVTDGNFPTVVSPNPEEPSALKLALELADKERADLVLATDPDADRIGIAVRNDKGEMVLLNGNQTGSLLTYYLLRRWKELGRITGTQYIVKTVVTSDLFARIAESFGVEYYNVLTGFKFIASVIRENEGKKQYIGGGEESYGYLIGDFVRDKDAVSSSVMIAEAMAWAKDNGMSLYDMLIDIYVKYGYFKESLVSIVKEGKEGAEAIKAMMHDFRINPPRSIAGSKVIRIADYERRKEQDLVTGETKAIDLPVSDVLQFVTEDQTVVSMRPSGTEPKIKFYFSVREELPSKERFDEAEQAAAEKIEAVKKDLKLI